MKQEYTIERKENGNIIFSYKRTKYKDTSLSFVISLLVLGTFLIWEFVETQTFYSLVIILPLSLFLSYKWMRKTEKINETEEQKIIFENLTPIISNAIASLGDTIKELERKYVIEEKDYSIGNRYVLVLLSNGSELRYNIINPKSYDRIQILEIDVNAVIIQ